jgi:hypothetical protein
MESGEVEEEKQKTQNFINRNILEITFNRTAVTSCIHRAFSTTRTRISYQTSWSKCNALGLYLGSAWFKS